VRNDPAPNDTLLTLPDARKRRLLSIEDAGRLFGMSRSAAYEAVRKGTFPVEVLRVGTRKRVRAVDVNRVCGFAPDGCTPIDSYFPLTSLASEGHSAHAPQS
jgi:predicted DNA-binding transcriptional regulator AlpA